MALARASSTPFFEWQDCHRLGIALIDGQHKQIVSLLNKLYSLLTCDRNSPAIHEALSELLRAVTQHFNTEEVLMGFTQYPEFPAHQSEHRELLERADALKRRIESGTGALDRGDLKFLRAWVIEHTAKSDRKYKPFVQEFLKTQLAIAASWTEPGPETKS